MSLGNNVGLIGRLTKDVEVKNGQNKTLVAPFTLARNNYAGQSEFFDCVAFGKNAEFLKKYFSKGKWVGIQGHLATSTWEREDGTKAKSTNIVVDSFEFIGDANNSFKNKNENDLDEKPNEQGADDNEDDLPF